jgi:mono/diheme cytochrome c family protein
VAQILGGDEERGMPPFDGSLEDRQVAAIATFVRNSWGNEFGVVLPEYVTRVR